MKAILSKLIGINDSAPQKLDLAWVEELDKLDDLAALETSTSMLKRYFNDDKTGEAEKLRALLAIDQQNRYRLKKTTQHFVGFQNIRPDLEARISDTVYYYLRQIFVCYRNLIQNFFHDPDDLVFNYKQLHIVIGRALHAAYSMTIWRYYNRQSVADMAWSEIFSLYRILEQESMLNMHIPLYKGEAEEHLAASFVQSCMQGSLGQSGLTRQQIEASTQILRKWLPWVSITKHYDEKKHMFYVDLSKDQPAKRIRSFSPTNDCRYWETDQLTAKIDAAIEAMDNGLPHDLENLADKTSLLELLLQLRSEWSRTGYRRERRAETRKRVIKSAAVIYDLQQIFERVRSMTAQNIQPSVISLEERLQNHRIGRAEPTVLYKDLAHERWMISDESASGYGVVVNNALDPAVKLGKLVGISIKDNAQGLCIGTVRSIKNLANDRHHLGIKLLSRNPSWLQVSHVKLGPPDQPPGDDLPASPQAILSRLLAFPALYLPSEPGLSDTPSLILPRIEFTEHSIYQINQGGKRSTIRLESGIEGKDDWIRVSYPE
ncbi:hypothetical protein MTYP_00909 [Methylophilaceae bacterium]|nr:hypothetical protein MTYP_00909 [Methylophilaceae bacterium]